MDALMLRRRATAVPEAVGGRLRPALPRIAQSAAAAAIAWLLAGLIPGHPSPVFAPIAALIALTATPGRRGRQAVQMILGILIGIVVADLFVVALGRGTWQLMVVVALAMTATTAAGLSSFMVAQASIWAAIVTALHGGYLAAAGRFVDGLIGAGVALVFVQLLFPVDPAELVDSAARPLYARIRVVLERLARALEEHDQDAARNALSAAEAIDDRALREAVAVAREVARRAPRRRRRRGWLEAWARAAGELDAIERDLVVLATGVLRSVRSGEARPAGLVSALRALAEVYGSLPELIADEDDAQELLDRCTASAAETAKALDDGFGAEMAVKQLGALVRDARRATGTDEGEREPEVPAGI